MLGAAEASPVRLSVVANVQPAHTSLAIFDLFSGRHEEARRRLRRALDLDPNSMYAHGYLGVSYAFGGDYDAALTSLEERRCASAREVRY